MESVVIKTVGCPLDPDLLKSFEQFSLESSHFLTSNHSESNDGETEINYDDLIEQYKNLKCYDVSDSKSVTSKCTNKITEISAQIKYSSEKHVETEENQSSPSLLQKKELLKAVVETDVESRLCKYLNKNYGINSKKNNTENHSFSENLENVENKLSSLSLKDDKFLNKYHKNGSDISAGDESDLDDEEQDESVILRERDPTRHNRPKNNIQQRPTPFDSNRKKTSKSNLSSNNSQTFENFSPYILYDFNGHHDGYNSINHSNSIDYEVDGILSPSNRTFNSCFPTTEWMTDDVLENDDGYNSLNHGICTDFERSGIFSPSFKTFNSHFCTSESLVDEVLEGTVSNTVTNQIVNGVSSCTVDELFDGVVPYPDDIGNESDKFFDGINDIPFFDNLKERIFTGSEVTYEEKEAFLNSCLKNLTAEEVENILKYPKDPKSDDRLSQNHDDLIEAPPLPLFSCKVVGKVFNDSSIINQNICHETTVQEINYPMNNQHNFRLELDHVEETSSCSNFNQEDSFLEQSGQINSCKNLATLYDNYSNLVCKNIASINCESLSPKASDYIIISNEIEHKIAKKKEKELAKNMSGLPHEFPFDDLDDKAILEFLKPSKNKMSNKNNDSKRQNQTCKPPCKTEKTKICWILGTAARDELFHSSSFCIRKWEDEDEKIRQQIERGNFGTNKKKVIHVLPKNRKTKYRGTNLHNALLSGNTEKVYCIVECHKEYHDDISEINIRDSDNKTVLDYSKERGMDLLTAYLKENLAKESINVQK